jgi:tetratricopeptide (TPR) repeat protein/tRNA A-37 threonylcarbamoyl transferase component Bud32
MDNDHDHLTTAGERPQSTGTVDHPSHPDESGPNEPPVVGDRYHIVTLHRSGGLGRVWVARDAALGRDVALKDLRPTRARDPRLRARFVEEARITGQLEHPSIVPLYDLIDGPDGPCYTMRFVAGRTLAEAAREYHDRRNAGRATRLDLAGLLDAFVAVCQAVAFAHSRGVLHRDLKGQNVVLGGYGEVFVLDWGLAKLATAPELAVPGALSAAGPVGVTPTPVGPRDETVTGAILGTPAFLAPEQAGGDPASTASDVYGLGAMLYVILTGAPPYDGPNMQDVLDRVLAGPPPQPQTMNPACPPGLEAICIKAMARDPAARYPAAAAVAADVRRWLADEPVEAYREPWPARAARWARRHRPAVIGVVAVLLTAVVGLAVSTTLVWQEERRTAEQRDRAERRLALTRGLSDSLLDLSEKYLAPVAPAEESRRAVVDEALAAARQTLNEQPDDPATQEWAARLYRYSANNHRLIDDTAGAAPSYAEAVRLYEALVARSPDNISTRNLLAETLRDQAQLLGKLGDLRAAAGRLERTVSLAEGLRAAAPENANYQRTLATALLDLSGVEDDRGRFPAAEVAAGRAADMFQVLLSAPRATAHKYDRLFLAAARSQQAEAQREQGRNEAALAAHVAAFRDFLVIMTPGDQNEKHFFCRALLGRGRTYTRLPKREDRALRDFTQAIDTWAQLQERAPRRAFYRQWQAVAFAERGQLQGNLGELKKAADDLEKSRSILVALVGENAAVPSYHADLGRTYAALGRLATTNHDAAASADWLTKAAAAFRVALGSAPDAAPVRKALETVDADRARQVGN